ncbi:MAG: D-alanyl-D-alanine carboxypeptidase family protein [Sporomusaceae bacterium]|nr:D-alanyl-D-alanine carboxypeptidase family protein [Sporomusaceae bacterium]
MVKRRSFIVFAVFLLLFSGLFPVAKAATAKDIPLSLTAQSAVLMDADGTILFEKDAHKPLPPASVTKTMTLLLAVEAVDQGKIQLTDQVTASSHAVRQGGSQIWLEQGEKMSVYELLTAVAVVSANDAAVALMEHIYGSEEAAIAAMNERAAALGLANTHFNSVNGLPVANHYMSAYDTALIVKEAVKYPLYLQVSGIKEYWLRGGKNWLVNTNKLLWWYDGADGLKTGWTEEAKYCFAGTAKRQNLRLIAVVFAAPEPRSHLKESMKLLDYGFSNYITLPVVAKGAVLEKVKVGKGVEHELSLVAAEDLNLLLLKGQSKVIQKQMKLTEPLVAPIVQGQKLGELTVMREGKEAGTVDLVAAKSIEKAGFIQILQETFTHFFAIASE